MFEPSRQAFAPQRKPLACYTLALQDIERYESMQRFCHTVPTASYILQHFDAFCMPMFAYVTFHAC